MQYLKPNNYYFIAIKDWNGITVNILQSYWQIGSYVQ